MRKALFSTLVILFCFLAVSAQHQQSSAWATDVGSRYWVQPDIVYQGALTIKEGGHGGFPQTDYVRSYDQSQA